MRRLLASSASSRGPHESSEPEHELADPVEVAPDHLTPEGSRGRRSFRLDGRGRCARRRVRRRRQVRRDDGRIQRHGRQQARLGGPGRIRQFDSTRACDRLGWRTNVVDVLVGVYVVVGGGGGV